MNNLLRILADFDFNQIILNRIVMDIEEYGVIVYIVFNGGHFIQMNITNNLLLLPKEELIKDFKEMFEKEFQALKIRTKSFKETNI